MKRRGFVKLCAAAAAAVHANPGLLAAGKPGAGTFPRARLVDASQRPLKAADLAPGRTYLFHYPYVSTPCFLLRLAGPAIEAAELETEVGERYRWDGGIGPDRSIVAFSAICAHKMSYPTRSVSFINYRDDPVRFEDADKNLAEGSQLIYCCSEKSVYDVRGGARVLGGPAPQPLAAVRLEHDASDDGLYASGVLGADMFARFFEAFGFRLMLDHRSTDVERLVEDQTAVLAMEDYCGNPILC